MRGPKRPTLDVRNLWGNSFFPAERSSLERKGVLANKKGQKFPPEPKNEFTSLDLVSTILGYIGIIGDYVGEI